MYNTVIGLLSRSSLLSKRQAGFTRKMYTGTSKARAQKGNHLHEHWNQKFATRFSTTPFGGPHQASSISVREIPSAPVITYKTNLRELLHDDASRYTERVHRVLVGFVILADFRFARKQGRYPSRTRAEASLRIATIQFQTRSNFEAAYCLLESQK